MKKRVNVTGTDLRKGDRVQPCLCPIALAMQRIVKGTVDVAVGPDRFHLNHMNFVFYFQHREGHRVLVADCQPFFFDVDIPDVYLKHPQTAPDVKTFL